MSLGPEDKGAYQSTSYPQTFESHSLKNLNVNMSTLWIATDGPYLLETAKELKQPQSLSESSFGLLGTQRNNVPRTSSHIFSALTSVIVR